MDVPHHIHGRSLVALVAAGVGLLIASAAGIYYSQSSQGQVRPQPITAPTPLQVETHNPLVRVNLTVNPATQIAVSVDSPYRVIAPGTTTILAHGDKLATTNVTASNNAIRVGTSEFRINQIEIVPINAPAVWVANHLYRGTVRITRVASGKLIAVNEVRLEDYLASVVNSEMPASFGRAAREAQAIVARTYVLAQMTGHPQFDVYSTTRSQKYNGYQYLDDAGKKLAGESPNSREIVRDTAGIVCTSGGKLFTTYYTAACGGRTLSGQTVFEDAAIVQKSVPCDWCREASFYRWQTTIDRLKADQLLRDHFKTQGKTFGRLSSITPVVKTTGDLPYYAIRDEKSSFEIAGTTLRRVFPYGVLYSPTFTAALTATEIRFSGQGHGHGVGLCQWGAGGLAKAGRTSPEIISFYYPGSRLVRLRGTR